MKSCPTCNRTFDDTMSFCLVDGSILSAPFDPRATHDVPASRNTDPGRTEVLYPVPNAADPTRSYEEPLPDPETVASLTPSQQKETVSPPAPEYSSTAAVAPQPALKTMVASRPEVGFGDSGRAPSAPETPRASELPQTPAGGGKRLAVIAGSVLVVIVIGIIGVSVWFVQHNKISPLSTATTPSQQAKQPENKLPTTGQSFTENVNGVQIPMVSVPGGTFLMGSPVSETGRDKDEGPQGDVTVESLFMGKYEVTQAQYKAVTGANPSSFKGDDLPVDSVSWNDAIEFCRKLSQKTGREYRLPTEAEWEYAGRAGTNGPYAANMETMTWYGANSGSRTHPVGQMQPNAFGLYDMNGNVWEWCQSKYRPYPYKATDGREDLQPADVRVLRGGSWQSAAIYCRSAYRRRVIPDLRTVGFRIVSPAR